MWWVDGTNKKLSRNKNDKSVFILLYTNEVTKLNSKSNVTFKKLVVPQNLVLREVQV